MEGTEINIYNFRGKPLYNEHLPPPLELNYKLYFFKNDILYTFADEGKALELIDNNIVSDSSTVWLIHYF
jgi:hypothetical protein